MKIVGIAGSLRQASYAKAILRTLLALSPHGAQIEVLDIGALPHYNEDLEASDLPPSVADARHAISDADAIYIVTPEFNHSIPGVLKNALDWLSRPAFASPMAGKRVFFCTFSPGALGGVRAQSHLREVLASMLCELVPLVEVAITFVEEKIDGFALVDEKTVTFLQDVLARFLRVLDG